jgi:hypothetical protein
MTDILFLDFVKIARRRFHVCRDEGSILNMAWIYTREVGVVSKASKIEVDSNCRVVTFAIVG